MKAPRLSAIYAQYPRDSSGGISADIAHTLGAAEILLAELDAAGVVLSIVEAGLEFDGPEDALSDERLSLMRRHRAELMALVERREYVWQSSTLMVSSLSGPRQSSVRGASRIVSLMTMLPEL